MKNNHFVIDPDHPIMQENLYWLVTSDLVNLLSHNRIAYELIANSDHIQLWYEIVSYFQAMNMSVRKFGEHVQQEQPTYFSAFSAELECCSAIMWSIVHFFTQNQAITQPSNSYTHVQLINKLVKVSFEYLRKWLNDIGFMTALTPLKRPNYKHITFHLPLHR